MDEGPKPDGDIFQDHRRDADSESQQEKGAEIQHAA